MKYSVVGSEQSISLSSWPAPICFMVTNYLMETNLNCAQFATTGVMKMVSSI